MGLDDVGTMLADDRNRLGVARMLCYIGDYDTDVRRINVPLTPSRRAGVSGS
jgi:hypothetical protein